MNYTKVMHDQGSESWERWRRCGFGASDIPSVMGENRFKSYDQMIHEKINGCSGEMTDAMIRGVELEPIARSRYNDRINMNVQPARLQHNNYNWARASLDGISDDGEKIVEIKCGNSAFNKARKYGEIPDYYYGQLQHIMFFSV